MNTLLVKNAYLEEKGLSDIAITEGVISEIAPAGEIDARRYVQVFDTDGSWAFAGLWDEHVHVDLTAMNYSRIDLSATNSASEVLRVVGDYCSALSSAQIKPFVEGDFPLIIHGGGFRASGWPDHASVQHLDEVSCGLPVILISGDAHCGWMNTAGLRLLGLPIVDSLVAEAPWFAALSRYDQLPDYQARLFHGLEKLGEHCLAQGITGLKDMSFAKPVWEGQVPSIWRNLAVELCTYPDRLEERIANGLRSGSSIPFGQDKLRLTQGPLKIITDGSLGTRTAFCKHPYADGSHGVSNLRGEELKEVCQRAVENGYDLALHAIGDQAIDDVLQAFADTGAKGSIEHVQLLSEGQARQMAQMGISASVQPAHLLDDYPLAQKVWPSQMERCYRFSELSAAGVRLLMGSDSPVAELNPWLGMAAAVYRGDWERGSWEWNPSQRLSARQALEASNRGVQLAPGVTADLILVAQNPFLSDDTHGANQDENARMQAHHLVNIPVHATIAAGVLSYTA